MGGTYALCGGLTSLSIFRQLWRFKRSRLQDRCGLVGKNSVVAT